MTLNPFIRYQTGLTLSVLFPNQDDGSCACGCGKKLSGRRKRWYSDKCRDASVTLFFIVKGDGKVIREELFKRDGGKCACCNEVVKKWEADHILPVSMGGGACDLDNFQTLCKICHVEKTNHTLSPMF